MDAFIEAVESARTELIRVEGRSISMREVLRRAGIDEAGRPGASYHLNANRHTGDRAHNVPPELVERLGKVLPGGPEPLARAARVARGFNVLDDNHSSVEYVVQRFYGDEDVSEQRKAEVTARLLQIVADEQRRRFPTPAPPRNGTEDSRS